uniref:AA_permease domain-containing protein n=1 Tax=Panagrellus redivivus TaxID=6233 RepID=A0A7E4W312_PANRE
MTSQKLNLVQCIAYCIGDIIGSGIFVTPAYVLSNTQSAWLSLIVWVIGGVISALAAAVYIEFATTCKRSGGDFAFLLYAGWRTLATAFYVVVSSTAVGLENASFFDKKTTAGGIVLGIFSCIFAFNGWALLPISIEEVDHPKRNLPISTAIGLIVSIVVYVLMNASYLTVLTVDEFKSAETVITGILTICISFLGSLNDLINYTSFTFALQQLCVSCALIWVKWQKWIRNEVDPDVFEVPVVVPILYAVVALVITIIPFTTDWRIPMYGTVMFIVGLTVHFLILRRKRLPRFLKVIDEKLLTLGRIALDCHNPDVEPLELHA